MHIYSPFRKIFEIVEENCRREQEVFMADRSSSLRRSGGSRSHQRQASIDFGDLEEEDVWSAAKERGGGGGGGGDSTREAAAPRMIPRGTPSANEASTPHRSSAPVNIPDWLRIYGKSKRKVDGSGSGSGSSSAVMWNDFQRDKETGVRDEEEEEDEEDEGGIVPPHEWIARKLARSQISSNSMCEGIGRTLKGRDLSKVRNSVLTKTGFLE